MSCPICGAESAPDTVFAPSPLQRCTGCDFAFLPAAPEQGLYEEEYFADYDGEDYLAAEPARRFESRRRLDLLARYLQPPARLLEVGAAAGFFLDEARKRGYVGAGLELNDKMAGHARDVLGFEVTTGRLEDVELEAETFDGACAFHVLEHMPAPVEAVSAVRRALRPGGVLLVEVPNASSVVARRRAATGPLSSSLTTSASTARARWKRCSSGVDSRSSRSTPRPSRTTRPRDGSGLRSERGWRSARS